MLYVGYEDDGLSPLYMRLVCVLSNDLIFTSVCFLSRKVLFHFISFDPRKAYPAGRCMQVLTVYYQDVFAIARRQGTLSK